MSLESDVRDIKNEIDSIKNLLITPGGSIIHHINKFRADVIAAIKRHDYQNYVQIECLIKIFRHLEDVSELPSFRGWALSPDVTLRLYEEILHKRPRVVVEFGSGVSTLIIAHALRKNAYGQLISIEHDAEFYQKTNNSLIHNGLHPWVDMRLCELEKWPYSHMSESSPVWYRSDCLKGVERIDLVMVDGPPGTVCKYSRYPAFPCVASRLSDTASLWLDDTQREDEIAISRQWLNEFNLKKTSYQFDKGLIVFERVQ